MTRIDERTMWFASVLVLLSGFLFVVRPLEESIADARAQATANIELVARNDAIVHRTAALESERRRLGARLQRLALTGDPSSIVARFVAECVTVTSLHHVAVVAVSGVHGPTHTTAGDASLFESVPLNLTLRGSYADVLAAIRALSGGHVLAQIDVAALERVVGTHDGTGAKIDAHLRVAVQRMRPQLAPRGHDRVSESS